MRDLLVLAAGALVGTLAFPSEWIPGGWSFLGPLVLVPVFWFTGRRGPGFSALGGLVWATVQTAVGQGWLIAFHPLAFPLVWMFQAPWYALAFAVSSAIRLRLPSGGPWFQALWWTFFEFIKIQGFFGYPYGAVASTVWSWPLVYQSADLVGTSGITFLLAWTSAWASGWLIPGAPVQRWRTDLILGIALWAIDLGYGTWRFSEAVAGAPWKPALVQQSQDPWKSGPEAYEAGFDRLETLSRSAFGGHPDAIVWSETAFVPSVEYHTRYHENPDSLRLVRRLEAFLGTSPVPFLVGNDHREKLADGTTGDFNAVLAWDRGWVGRYEKVRLVPFTESFPYKDILPGVYQWLRDSDTHFWRPGTQRNLLTVGGVPLGTPVCYEDAFPDGAREFSLAGARVLVNLTNDSWSPGVASRMQHLSLAVFRAVETRLPLVRAGNDGATTAISARGEVLALLPIGPPGVLQAEVHLGTGRPTLYTQTGDWLPWVMVAAVAVALVARRRSGSVVDKGE